MQWSRQRWSRPHKQDDPYLHHYNDGKGASMGQQRIGRLIHGDDSFYWQDSVSDDPSSVSLNKLDTTDRVPTSVGSTSTPVRNVQHLVKKFEKSNSFPVRQTKWGTSATTSTTSISSASTCRYGMSTRAQASQTRYDVPDSFYSVEPHHNTSRASTLSTRAEQLAFDDFSSGDLLPDFIETTRHLLHQQHQPQRRQSIPSLTNRPKNGFLSRFQRRQKNHRCGDRPTPSASTRQKSLPVDTRTYEHPSDCFPPNDRGCAITFNDGPKKVEKTKSIMKRPGNRAPGHVNVPGSNDHDYFSAPSSSQPPLPPPSTTCQYEHQDETINEHRLVSLQALFQESKPHHHHDSESRTLSSSTRRWGYAHKVDAGGGGLAAWSIRAAENENETSHEPQHDSKMAKYDPQSSSTISTTKFRRPRELSLRLEHSFSSLNEDEEHEIVFVSLDNHDDDEGRPDRKHEQPKSQQRDDIDASQEILTDCVTRDSASGTREHLLAVVDEEDEEIVFEADQDEESENHEGTTVIEEQVFGSSLSAVAAIPSFASMDSRGGGSLPFNTMSKSVDDVHDEDMLKTGIEMVLEELYPPRPRGHRNSERDYRSHRCADQSIVVHVSMSEETVKASPTSIDSQRYKQEKGVHDTKCSIETNVSSGDKLPTADDSPTLRTENPCNDQRQSNQCTNSIPPVDGDWSYSTALSHKSSGESSIDRARKERLSVHSRANATVTVETIISRATDLLIFRTHDFFFPRSKSLNVKPHQRSESEIHSMCQKLSNLVYPHESSVVAQASIPSSIPTKIGLSLEQHEWRFVVRSIEKDSPFANTPLKAGQTLLSINAIPVNCFESVGEVVEYLCSREWSSDDGNGNNPYDSILSIVATRSIYASVIKPTADTLVGLGFAMNQHTGTLKIHHVDQHGLFGLKGYLIGGLKVLRLNGKPCPRTSAALNGMLKSCVGLFTIVALPDDVP